MFTRARKMREVAPKRDLSRKVPEANVQCTRENTWPEVILDLSLRAAFRFTRYLTSGLEFLQNEIK